MQKLMLLSFFILLNFFSANAQPSYYEFQRNIQASRNNAAYIDAIEAQARTPNSPYVRTGIDRSVFDRPVKIVTEAEQERRAEYRKKAAAEFKAAVDKIIAKYDAIDNVAAFYNTLKLPILKEDIYRLSKLSITDEASYSPDYENLLEMSAYVKVFNDELATAKFEDLVQTIMQYQILSLTAIESVNKLKVKFPNREFETNLLIVQLLPGFFDGISFDKSFHNYYRHLDWKTISDQDPKWVEMTKLYAGIYKKYPRQVADLIGKMPGFSKQYWLLSKLFYEQDMGPKEPLLKSIFGEKLKPNKEAEELKYLFMHTPNKLITTIDDGFRDALIRNMDVDEISALSTLHNMPASDIFIGQVWGDAYDRGSPTYLNAKYNESDWIKTDYLGKNKIKLIRAFAEKGDKDAMTVLALRISRGFEKEKRSEALAWIQKAAAIEDNRSYNSIKYAMVRTQKALEDISNMKF